MICIILYVNKKAPIKINNNKKGINTKNQDTAGYPALQIRFNTHVQNNM
jgi:hypothetical protein